MRNNDILEKKLDRIWTDYFQDVPKFNNVEIRFGRKAIKRLGSIREIQKCPTVSNNFNTLIFINGRFKDKKIPDFIIEATIAHELCHYAQGFGSPLPQLSHYPHRGGRVDKELEKRGLKNLIEEEQSWLNKNWIKYLSTNR